MPKITPEVVPSEVEVAPVDPLAGLVEIEPEPVLVEVTDKKAKKVDAPEWIEVPFEDLRKVIFIDGERKYRLDALGFRGDYRLREARID